LSSSSTSAPRVIAVVALLVNVSMVDVHVGLMSAATPGEEGLLPRRPVRYAQRRFDSTFGRGLTDQEKG
jgi:hypothetical protein